MKTDELSKFENSLDGIKQVMIEQDENFQKLKDDIKDYDELLPDTDLEILCKFIERIANLYVILNENKKKMKEMNLGLNKMKIRIGDVDLHQACEEFEKDNESSKERLTDLNKKANLLIDNCKEYEGYASD